MSTRSTSNTFSTFRTCGTLITILSHCDVAKNQTVATKPPVALNPIKKSNNREAEEKTRGGKHHKESRMFEKYGLSQKSYGYIYIYIYIYVINFAQACDEFLRVLPDVRERPAARA